MNKELARILDTSPDDGAVINNHRTMSVSARRKIAAAQKARWAKLRKAKEGSGKPAAKKKTMSAAAKSKLSPR